MRARPAIQTYVSGALLPCLLLMGCSVTEPLPAGATTLIPLPVYSLWWSMAESCSGLNRPMADVSWYSVPGAEFAAGSDTLDAAYQVDKNRIIIGDNWLTNGSIVRHEMLHALVHQAGGTTHPRAYFLEKCAGVVSCDQDCIASSDAAPIPPAGTPMGSVDSLVLSIEVTPADVSLASYGGLEYGVVTVKVRNAATHAVLLAPLIDPHLGTDSTFSYHVDGLLTPPIFGFAHLYDPEQVFFLAGETKQQVFDMFLEQATPAPLGTYTATGSFGGHAPASVTFRVVP